MTEPVFILPDTVRSITEHLSSMNIAAFPVGGCVRDFLMGRVPQDIDLAAECTPEELREALEIFSCSYEGFGYGSVSVHINGEKTEITCCRREDGYSDGRRPDRVDYTRSIRDDLARRDFTVNAMAYDIKSGEIIDPFGGAKDIGLGIIRCVGDPRRRFGEDALRILRALRFASVLGFSIETGTADAVHEMRESLSRLSGTRVFSELMKLLSGDGVFGVLTEYSDIICTLIPELSPSVGFDQHNPHHVYTVYEHTARAVAACPPGGNLRLAMLLHDMAKPKVCTVDSHGIYHFRGHPDEGAIMAEALLYRLGADRECIKDVTLLIKYHDVRPAPTRTDIRKYLCDIGYTAALELLHIRRADLSAQAPEYRAEGTKYIDECERLILEAKNEGAPVSVAELAVNGENAVAAGIPEGPAVGEALKQLLQLVSEEKLPNCKDALAAQLRRMAQDAGER